MVEPGSKTTAHIDTFVRDNLPPRGLWPSLEFAGPLQLAAYPNRLNAAAELIDRRIGAGDGARTAILFGDTVWSYAELHERASRIARVLVEDMGVVTGNRVLLRAPNTPMLAAAWLAVLKAGAVCVATMPLLRERELTFIIAKARVSHALCDITLADELIAAQACVPNLRQVSYFSAAGDGDGDLDKRCAAKTSGFTAVDTAADDPALIAFTSGTTGQPKGTVHFHRDVLAMTDCFPKHVFSAAPDEIYTGTPPLAFTFGLGALLAFPLRYGAAVALIDKPSPDALLETVARHKCTALFTAPTMYRTLAERTGEADLSSLTKCVSAGEHLPKPVFESWHGATGLKIIDGIGATEMIHMFISASGDAIRPGATGRAIPGYEACIMDDGGAFLPPGEVGNLAVRGPTGCRYLDDIERQKSYVKGGWNLPGDLYRQDEDGYFWYQARADDMIVSAGYNISGPEIEAVLLDHPRVSECAVVGAPDRDRGQIVKAYVVLRGECPHTDTVAKELQDHVRGEIAPYKYPRAVEFVEALPRTETGKVQRFKLRTGEAKGTARP